MENDRFQDIENQIAEARKTMPDCDTADAIDRDDGWGDIATHAERDGYEDLVELCNDAQKEWDTTEI